MLGMKLETYLKQINQWMMANWIPITLSILLLKLLYQAVRYLKKETSTLKSWNSLYHFK